MTHSMVDSKRSGKKNCECGSYFLISNAKKLIKYLINSCFFTNKVDVNCENIYVRVETVRSHSFIKTSRLNC